MNRHEALPSGDPLLCRTCRQKIFWVRDGEEERVYHHVSELLASDIPSALHSALRRIYPLRSVRHFQDRCVLVISHVKLDKKTRVHLTTSIVSEPPSTRTMWIRPDLLSVSRPLKNSSDEIARP